MAGQCQWTVGARFVSYSIDRAMNGNVDRILNIIYDIPTQTVLEMEPIIIYNDDCDLFGTANTRR